MNLNLFTLTRICGEQRREIEKGRGLNDAARKARGQSAAARQARGPSPAARQARGPSPAARQTRKAISLYLKSKPKIYAHSRQPRERGRHHGKMVATYM